VAVGDRSRVTAQQLWNSLPGVYRQCDALSLSKGAVSYTDFWEAYSMILPGCRHRAVGEGNWKDKSYFGKLSTGIERFNCTLRQRISRLVRKTLITLVQFGILFTIITLLS